MGMWTVVNTVYFEDEISKIYGYRVANEDNTKRRIISSKTANLLTLKGELKVANYQELSFCTVIRNYEEKQWDTE